MNFAGGKDQFFLICNFFGFKRIIIYLTTAEVVSKEKNHRKDTKTQKNIIDYLRHSALAVKEKIDL